MIHTCTGTHLVDLTVESTWVRKMIEQHHVAAVASGAKIIHSAGFDSTPADLGTYMIADHLKRVHNAATAAVTYYCSKMSPGGVSGGTVASIRGIAEEAWDGARSQLSDPYLLCPADARPSYSNPRCVCTT
jgi:short subunit dehydrogenase-like uncharacterized protein